MDAWDDDKEQPAGDALYAEPLLSAEEEYRLFAVYRAGRPASEAEGPMTRAAHEARQRIILANTKWVRANATRYAAHHRIGGLTLDDLIQEGMIGLMRAFDKYDSALGFRFTTAATPWILQAIGRALANTAEMIREPVHVKTDRSKARKRGETVPVPWQVLSLDAPVGNDSDNEPLGDFIADERTPLMADVVTERVGWHQTLYVALGRLTARQRTVIELRFGLSNSGAGMTLEEVGAALNVTRERVRQIQVMAMTALRLALRETAEGDVALRHAERMLTLVETARAQKTRQQAAYRAAETKRRKRIEDQPLLAS